MPHPPPFRDEGELARVRDGWRLWRGMFHHDPPPYGVPIAIWRPEFPQEYVVMAEELRPEMNIAGLYWKLWPYD